MHASYRYLLIVVALAAMLCLLPAQGRMRRARRNRRRRGKRTPWKRPPGRIFPSKRTGTHICTERCITRPAATASSGGKLPARLVG